MAGTWQLQEAKNKLSKVVDEAIRCGPQVITRHGVEVAIVLSLDEYRRLASSQEKLADFFRHSPLAEVDIDLSRDKSPVREDFAL
jgi:antitoxin Phd